MTDLADRLQRIKDSDHARGCMGRQYSCTCGYDDRKDALLVEAAAAMALPVALAQDAPTKPIAYAVFTDGGNIRLWSKTTKEIEAWAAEKGLKVVELYAAPACQSPAGCVTADQLALEIYRADSDNDGFEPAIETRMYRDGYLAPAIAILQKFDVRPK